jgi:hypothetical protein
MKFLISALLICLCVNAKAIERGTLRVSALAGQVGLFGDPGNGGANALGLAGSAGFQVSDALALELRYLNSSHSDVNHGDLSVGGEYAFGDFESGYPHGEIGMSFIHNEFKSGSISGDAAGLYIGGGLDFELARQLQIGPDVRFVKAFTTHGQVNGVDTTMVGDNYSVMIRISYLLDLTD